MLSWMPVIMLAIFTGTIGIALLIFHHARSVSYSFFPAGRLRASMFKRWRWFEAAVKQIAPPPLAARAGDTAVASSARTLPRAADVQWQLGQAIEQMPLGVTITDVSGKILYVNPAEAAMHGCAVEELIGKDLGVLAPPELRHPLSADDMRALRPLRETVNMRKDGAIFPVRLMANVVKDGAGQPVAVVTTSEDISERRKTAEKLRQQAQELSLLNHLGEALQACEREEETYSMIAEVCQKLFPEDSGCLCMMRPADSTMQVVNFWGNAAYQDERGAAGVPAQDTGLCPHRLSHAQHECVSIPIMASDEILGLLSVCSLHAAAPDEASAKQTVLSRAASHYALTLVNLRLRETLKQEAIHDPLTGLYNRRYMEEALQQEAHRAQRHRGHIGVLMLDIDHFKRFNDLRGHQTGDVVLRELGAFLRANVRREDVACRYGGEEFLIILPNADLEIARQRAEDLRNDLKRLSCVARGKAFAVTVSIGVAAFPEHGREIADVVHCSDLALYEAKRRGRDRVVTAAAPNA